MEEDFYWYAPMVFQTYVQHNLVSHKQHAHLIMLDPTDFIKGSQRVEINGRVLYIKSNQIYIDSLHPEEAELPDNSSY